MRHCERNPRHHQQRRVVFGIFLILAGVLALMSNLLHLDVGSAWDYWPVLFCIIGVLKLLHARRPGGRITGLALVVLGSGWTLQNLGLVHNAMPLILAVLLILAGAGFILRAFSRPESPQHRSGHLRETVAHDDTVSVDATLSGTTVRCDAPAFRGGELRAVLGGIKLDLRQAGLASVAELQVYAVCGGIEIRIPPDWSVQVKVSPVLGGVEDKTVPPAVPAGTLVLTGETVMGGIEIRN